MNKLVKPTNLQLPEATASLIKKPQSQKAYQQALRGVEIRLRSTAC